MPRKQRIQKEAQALTLHARKRRQQRGIPPERIDVVVRFGKRRWAKGGVYRCSMTKRGRERAARELGSGYAPIADKLDFYVIICPLSYKVITAGYPKRRLKWKR